MKVRTEIVNAKRFWNVGLAMAALPLFAMASFGCLQAGAQSENQAAEVVKSLNAASQTAVQRLSELDQLPADDWRFHAGDMAHGESPDLDDSSWKAAKPRMD